MLLLIGVIFGYGVKGTPTGSVFMTRAYQTGRIVVALFAILVYYSYRLAPDWMFNYFTKASEVPIWMIIYLFVLYFVAYAAGFLIKFELGKIHKVLPILFGLILLAASVTIPTALGDRYTMVGTIEQFNNGNAVPLAQSAVGKVPGMLTLALVPIGLGFFFWSRKQRF